MTAFGGVGLAVWPEAEAGDPFADLWREAERAASGPGVTPIAGETFRAYVTRVRPAFQWYRHACVLADVLQRVADGQLRRVIVQMPPRHGKSEEVSRLFPAYYLSRHPARWVGLTSYGAELAYTLSRAARENFGRGGGVTRDDAAAVKHWETSQGGGLWATGFGGPLTGKGFHLGIVDDPVKDAAEAASETIARRNREWYPSTFLSRAEPDAAIVIVQTRWPGPADLVGWLFEQEGSEDDAPEHWHVVSLEAVKEPDTPALPPTCTLEPDWRQAGDALCPERYPATRLRQIEKRASPYWWSALYQQRPKPRDGGMFRREMFEIVDRAPTQARRVRYWDHASTPGAGDYTVGTREAMTADGVTYVEDVTRGQWETGQRDRTIRQTAALDGREVVQWGQQEPGSSGKDAALNFRKLLAGFPVYTEPVTGSKEVRAEPFASAAHAGLVKLVRGDWNKAWLDEVCDFPFGRHDDQTETAAGAYVKLAALSQTAPRRPSRVTYTG